MRVNNPSRFSPIFAGKSNRMGSLCTRRCTQPRNIACRQLLGAFAPASETIRHDAGAAVSAMGPEVTLSTQLEGNY